MFSHDFPPLCAQLLDFPFASEAQLDQTADRFRARQRLALLRDLSVETVLEAGDHARLVRLTHAQFANLTADARRGRFSVHM